MHIWPIENLSELTSIVTKWADKRRMSALNEDFISIDDLHNDMTCLESEQMSFFHRCSYNTAIVIYQANERGEFSQKIMSLAKKLESTMNMILNGKCFVEIGAYSEETAKLTGSDVHVFSDEEIEFMYPNQKTREMINYNITETFVWFDMPKKFD